MTVLLSQQEHGNHRVGWVALSKRNPSSWRSVDGLNGQLTVQPILQLTAIFWRTAHATFFVSIRK